METNTQPNLTLLVDEARQLKSFNKFKATVRLAISQGQGVPIRYEERSGWRFGGIIVHKDGDVYQLSSVNGYAFSGKHGRNYRTQRGALRAAWVISHFTEGVLNDKGEMIVATNSESPALQAMRTAIIICDEAFRG